MNRLLLGLMLLMTATAASAEWNLVDESESFVQYVDIATLRRSGNLVKLWDLRAYKTAQTLAGDSYFSNKAQQEYDCKEERVRALAYTFFDGKMGNGKIVFTNSETSMKWQPIEPGSVGETLWKIACGKK